MTINSKTEAQQRADQIDSFQFELELLKRDGIVTLETEQYSRISVYHDGLLRQMTEQFDIDSNQRARQLSLGMKVTSFLGAIALGASLFFLFYQRVSLRAMLVIGFQQVRE